MKALLFNRDGKTVPVYAAKVGHSLWVHLNGETWEFDQKPKNVRRSGAATAGELGDILSPMPGKILKVNVKIGDRVTEKQLLIVMEAMKMEYSLLAPAGGSVKEIYCIQGQQVELGQKLAHIEKDA